MVAGRYGLLKCIKSNAQIKIFSSLTRKQMQIWTNTANLIPKLS